MARKQANTEQHPSAASLRAVDLFAELEPRELDVLANVARDYQFAGATSSSPKGTRAAAST